MGDTSEYGWKDLTGVRPLSMLLKNKAFQTQHIPASKKYCSGETP
jgi:hypothetical protein